MRTAVFTPRRNRDTPGSPVPSRGSEPPGKVLARHGVGLAPGYSGTWIQLRGEGRERLFNPMWLFRNTRVSGRKKNKKLMLGIFVPKSCLKF